MLLNRAENNLQFRRKFQKNILDKRDINSQLSFDNLIDTASQDIKLMRLMIDEANQRGMLQSVQSEETADTLVNPRARTQFLQKRQKMQNSNFRQSRDYYDRRIKPIVEAQQRANSEQPKPSFKVTSIEVAQINNSIYESQWLKRYKKNIRESRLDLQYSGKKGGFDPSIKIQKIDSVDVSQIMGLEDTYDEKDPYNQKKDTSQVLSTVMSQDIEIREDPEANFIDEIKDIHDFMKVDVASKQGSRRSFSASMQSDSGSNSRNGSLSKGSAGLKMMTDIGAQALKKQKKRKLPQIEIDTNNPKLRNFFKSITVNLKMDEQKFMVALQQEFKEQAEEICQIIKKFIHFRQSNFDFRQYCDAIRKFVSIDVQQQKELYFNFLDKNKDKKVDETDLFNVMKSIVSFNTSEMIVPDVLIALKFIENHRKTLGKNDENQMRKKQIEQNIELAMKSKTQIMRKNVNEEVKEFLREIQKHQDRQKLETELALNPLNLELVKKLGDLENEQKDYKIPLSMKPFMNKEINFQLFVELLSEKVDIQKVSFNQRMLKDIEFTKHGMPILIIKIFCFLTQLSEKEILDKKLEQLFPELAMYKIPTQPSQNGEQAPDQEEVDELKDQRSTYGKMLNFLQYEQFFRTFCMNKYVQNDHELRANFKSFSKGIQFWYAGKENKFLSKLLYFYIGKGKSNHLIKFSEFMYFVVELTLSDYHKNFLIFKLLSENHPYLDILAMLRQYVNSQPISKFSKEIWKFIEHYIEKTLMPKEYKKDIKDYNRALYHKIIPKSCLINELIDKFLETPKQAFKEEGDPNPLFDDVNKYDIRQRQESVFFTPYMPKSMISSMSQQLVDEIENEKYIRRYQYLFYLKINKENLEHILKELMKYQ